MLNNTLFNSAVSTIDMPRSRFNRPSNVKFTCNEGDLVPFFVDEVLPGDTFEMSTTSLVRMTTLLTPIMDDLFMDIYYFFVPNRIVWDHFKEFMGENTESAWVPTTVYTIPQIQAPTNGWEANTIADSLGVPINKGGFSINALPFRCFASIFDSWFRDENLMDPVLFNKDESTVTGVNTGNYITDIALGGKFPKVCKFHDYFTSCLPGPQKGPSVDIPLGDFAPVFAKSDDHDFKTYYNKYGNNPILFKGFSVNPEVASDWELLGARTTGLRSDGTFGTELNGSYSGNVALGAFSNLAADLSSSSAISVNQLRIAFQLQKFYETQARCGSRYTEIIKGFFGVDSPDARLQRPEYLGGDRIRININQVVQTSNSQAGSTPQGNLSAFSLTFNKDSSFIKSFTEHGYIIGCSCIRHHHIYQQGLEKFWSRKNREDFYFPVFANIGEQPVLNKEIYLQGNSADDEVFGYQEAWADYRYKPSRVSGELRSTYSSSLDVWHLGDLYSDQPILSDTWIKENSNILDRCLAVNSSVASQFIASFYMDCKVSRCMPLFSIPGLIDHH